MEAVYEKSYETIIGNCDTHVFLGSNSQKTVEYFSKALGEKTISKDQLSKSRDKHNFWTQGYNASEQIMARALMTPDELRRMDNDLCIIFEKGLKPIKTRKYYYFEHQKVIKDLQSYTINHNEFQGIERGEWRKYNPYNPYVPEKDKEENKVDNLKVESLDDLFEDDEKEPVKTAANNIEQEAPVLPNEEIKEEPKQEKTEDQKEIDLQKELEAKFDELFGPIDDE